MGPLQISKSAFTTTRVWMKPLSRFTKCRSQLLGIDPKALIQTQYLKSIKGWHDRDEICDLASWLATTFAAGPFHLTKKPPSGMTERRLDDFYLRIRR